MSETPPWHVAKIIPRKLLCLFLVGLRHNDEPLTLQEEWNETTMLHICMVKFSSQFCTLSVRDIMAAIFDLITASEDKGLPNALR